MIKKGHGKGRGNRGAGKAKAKAKAIQLGEDVEQLMVNEWLQKEARVVDEEASAQYLGRSGTVVKVFLVKPHSGEAEYWRLHIAEESQWHSDFKGFFGAKASWCQDKAHESKVKVLLGHIDVGTFKGPIKKNIQEELQVVAHPENLEFVVPNTMIEHMTIRAALLEKALRFSDSEVKKKPPPSLLK